jgi:hypothetical protein
MELRRAKLQGLRSARVGQELVSQQIVCHRRRRAERLLALQQELAQLKRTPSMQLLACQRIPRLEEAIKHLIAELQERA